MDIDNLIKSIREDKHFPSPTYSRCTHCGTKIPRRPTTQDEELVHIERYDDLCIGCSLKKMHDLGDNEIPPETLRSLAECRFCFKRKKLIGLWCLSCRMKCHRKQIKEILSKDRSSWSDTDVLTMRILSYMPIWKKEFRKVQKTW